MQIKKVIFYKTAMKKLYKELTVLFRKATLLFVVMLIDVVSTILVACGLHQ